MTLAIQNSIKLCIPSLHLSRGQRPAWDTEVWMRDTTLRLRTRLLAAPRIPGMGPPSDSPSWLSSGEHRLASLKSRREDFDQARLLRGHRVGPVARDLPLCEGALLAGRPNQF